MDTRLPFLIVNLAVASSLLPIILGWIRFRNNPPGLKLIFLLASTSFFCDITSIILLFVFRANNNYPGNLYRLAEFLILLILYFKTWHNPKWTSFFIATGFSFILFFSYNLIFLQQERINSYTNVCSALTFIPLSLIYFYIFMKAPAASKPQPPMFWFNTGILLYFSGNLFVFILTNYSIANNASDFVIFWTFHNFLSIAKNIFFGIGLWLNLRTPRLL